jgi:anti-sigma factor RsiW
MTNAQHSAASFDELPLLVHAYLDGELDPANSLAVARRIAGDPVLAAEVENIEALRQAVREKLPPEPVSPQLRSRIEAAIGRTTRKPAHPSWQALAASVVLALALGSASTWIAVRPAADNHVVESVVDSHMRGLMAQQPTDIASSDRHTVKPWFNGRVDVIDTVPVATLVYGRRAHIISLSAIPAATSPQAVSPHKPIKGYNLVQWSDDGVDYWAASDLNAGELQTFARLFQAAVRP